MKITYSFDGLGFTVYPVSKNQRRKLEGPASGKCDCSLYYQTDYSWPALAGMFGWRMAKPGGCRHSSTDGTVECRDCGKAASEFIQEAFDYLTTHEGKVVHDDLDLFG